VSDQKPSTAQIRQAIVSSLIGDVGHPCISIAHILRGLRKTLPLDEHSDWELEDLIALIAVDAGFAIEFDGSARALKTDRITWYQAPLGKAKPSLLTGMTFGVTRVNSR
jgi:hypothetical protein